MTKQLAVNCFPLILLGRISRLDLLPALAERVVVPSAVIGELKSKDHEDWLAQTVSSHPGIEVVDAPSPTAEIQRWRLGEVETAVLSFCLANPGFRAVLDDLRGRRCALALGMPISGTLGHPGEGSVLTRGSLARHLRFFSWERRLAGDRRSHGWRCRFAAFTPLSRRSGWAARRALPKSRDGKAVGAAVNSLALKGPNMQPRTGSAPAPALGDQIPRSTRPCRGRRGE